MRRREFITLLGSAAAARPLAARAQQRRIGVLMSRAADDREGQARLAGLVEGLEQFDMTDRRDARIETRSPVGDADAAIRGGIWSRCADVILASASANVAALQRITRSMPIVFANVIDPVGAGFVASLARPGGNITGFLAFEYSLSGKWLELLKEIAPNLTRAAVLRDPALAAGIGQFAVIQAMAPASFGVGLTPIDVRDPGEMERAIVAFARERNGGLIVTASQGSVIHRDLIISLAIAVPPAERLRVPILPREWRPRLLRA